MGAKTLTISLPEDQLVFLDENPVLKPSHIFQKAVEDIRNSLKNNPALLEANKKIIKLEKSLGQCQMFIINKNLLIEFEKWAKD